MHKFTLGVNSLKYQNDMKKAMGVEYPMDRIKEIMLKTEEKDFGWLVANLSGDDVCARYVFERETKRDLPKSVNGVFNLLQEYCHESYLKWFRQNVINPTAAPSGMQSDVTRRNSVMEKNLDLYLRFFMVDACVADRNAARNELKRRYWMSCNGGKCKMYSMKEYVETLVKSGDCMPVEIPADGVTQTADMYAIYSRQGRGFIAPMDVPRLVYEYVKYIMDNMDVLEKVETAAD